MQLLRRRRSRQTQKIQQDIEKALDAIRPILRIDECALTLSRFDADSGTAVLEVQGVCPACDVTVATFLQGIETQMKLRVPEVTSVRFAEERAR